MDAVVLINFVSTSTEMPQQTCVRAGMQICFKHIIKTNTSPKMHFIPPKPQNLGTGLRQNANLERPAWGAIMPFGAIIIASCLWSRLWVMADNYIGHNSRSALESQWRHFRIRKTATHLLRYVACTCDVIMMSALCCLGLTPVEFDILQKLYFLRKED